MTPLYADDLWSDITLSGKTRYRNPFLDRVAAAEPVRVLIISELNQCVTIAALVHSIGRFSTRMACSAESALTLAADFVPDIVLLTIALPELASYRVAATLRWQSGRPAPRLIALTDDIATSDRSRALAAGFEQYVTVPVRRAALEGALLRRASAAAPPARFFRFAHN
ncbi:MAG TPA: response regulator [Steroidobacteraceae bacterium]|jgi:CheY-like chemotaxis protein